MVSIAKRVQRLKKLYNMRCGDGAALLPSNVSKIHLTFPIRQKGGHIGARQFWRHIFPRMKYYNPSVQMMVSRPVDIGGECLMRIYVKRTKGARFLPAKDIQELKPSGEAKVAITPIEYNGTYVPALPSAFPPPKASYDEDLIEIPMKDLPYQHIWEAFKRAVPVTKVSNEVAMSKDVDEITDTHKMQSGEVEGEAGKRWLEMFRLEQGFAREIELLESRREEREHREASKAAQEAQEPAIAR